VVNREEAAKIGKENPDFFFFTWTERRWTCLWTLISMIRRFYEKARENLLQMEEKGILGVGSEALFTIYMNWCGREKSRQVLWAVLPLMII